MNNRTEFKGEQFGIRLEPRGENDPHICFQIISEDDEHWFEHKGSSSSAWITDLIEQLKIVKNYMKNNYKKDRDGCGYEF